MSINLVINLWVSLKCSYKDLLTLLLNICFFVFKGLTEFDEAKIPELPGDLNPNIEGS